MSDSDAMPFDDGRPQTRLYRSRNGEPLPRSEFWMRVAGAAFALWAIMIPIGISMIRSTLADSASGAVKIASDFADYRLTTERRLAILEDRQNGNIREVAEAKSQAVACVDRMTRIEIQQQGRAPR